ncbi:hypothetical protein [Desulfosarcina variabilis]|uniref:hypothetical protein n=1 Tax=Desulfosarcina variabilis TaxID=2300 RepID=UPI003AFB2A71
MVIRSPMAWREAATPSFQFTKAQSLSKAFKNEKIFKKTMQFKNAMAPALW